MNFGLRSFAVVAVVVIAAALFVSPWIGFAFFLGAACFFAVIRARNDEAVRELLRDPAAAAMPFSQAISTLRTKLKDGEQSLRDRDEEIAQRRQITNAIPDGLFLLDREQRIVWCNQSALVMHSFDAFRDVGKPIGQLIRAPEFLSYLNDSTLPEPIITLDSRMILFHIEPARDGMRLLLARDVTDRERLDRMRRDFVANVSHELRTPLTVMTGYIETIRDLPLSDEDRTRYVSLIGAQTTNMTRLVADLLTLARLENAQLPSENADFDLVSVVRDALADAAALSSGSHRFNEHIEPPITMRGSASELRAAVANLLSNAVRYTPAGGEISTRASLIEHTIIVEVRDTGVGIASEHIARLTERFYRVDRSRSRDTGGTGLGLAIVKHVVQRHRGTLEIESEFGRGSVFRMRFPTS